MSSGEKKRYRWRRRPILIEENLVINSTTVTTTSEKEKHTTESQQRKWYKSIDDDNDDDDDDNDNGDTKNSQSLSTRVFPNETIAEKIDRILKKINAWTNETSIPINKPTKSPSNYDNVAKPDTNSTTFRQRCSSSSIQENPSMIKVQRISNPRPYSMAFIDEPYRLNSFNEQQYPSKLTKRNFPRRNFYYPNQRTLISPSTNLTSLSSLYGSDFFYPATSEIEQHEYDNIPFTDSCSSSTRHYDPFPTIVVDCQRCSQSVDRSLFRDISCQVPSDEDLDKDSQLEERKTTRSSPLYVSPRSSPPLCHPPTANSLLAPYHFRRKQSLSSYVALHNRSRSVPSSSSTTSSISNQKLDLLPKFSPRPIVSDSISNPSTTTLLRSIKTSINAMKRRLKDIRRLSEVGLLVFLFSLCFNNNIYTHD